MEHQQFDDPKKDQDHANQLSIEIKIKHRQWEETGYFLQISH